MSDKDEGATIFEDKTVEGSVEEPVVSVADQYAELIGEGKKYKSIEAALSSVAPAQDHISKLEQEMAELKAELDKRKTVEDALNSLVTSKGSEETPSSNTLDEGAIETLVANVLNKTESKKTQENNILSVDAKMKEVYGEKAVEKLNAKAQELGVGVDFMMSLAAKSPVAFLNQFGINNQSTTGNHKPSEGSINTQVFQGTPPVKPKSVMRNATTKDMVNAWRAAGDQSNS